MPFKPSTCKALKLLSCSAISVVVADLISEGMHSSPASNTSFLTYKATPTTRDPVNKLETKILILSSGIDEFRLAIEETERTEVIGHCQKYSDDRFTDLELEKIESEQLSANVHKLREWFDSVIETDSGNGEEASRAALNTLSLHYEKKTVVMALLSATYYPDKHTKSMAYHMIKAQFQKWVEDGKTAGDVFALLDLDKLARDLLGSPAFVLWAYFVRAASPNSEAAKRAMFNFLSGHNDDAAFSDALLAGSKIKAVETIAFDLELAQVEKWTKEHKTYKIYLRA